MSVSLRAILLFSLAHSTALFSHSNFHEKSLELDKDKVVKILKCVRTITEQRLGGPLGLEYAYNHLKELGSENENLSEIYSRCEQDRLGLGKSSMPREDQLQAIQQLKNDDQNPDEVAQKSMTLLMTFIKPKVICKSVGLFGDWGYLIGFSNKAEGSYCVSENGRHWIEFSPGAGFGVSIGVMAGVSQREQTRHDYQNWIPLKFSQFNSQAFVVAGGLKTISQSDPTKSGPRNRLFTKGVQYNEKERIPLPNFDQSVEGFGVGLMLEGLIEGLELNITILSLGTKDDDLYKTYHRIFH